jgi:hypothetical protein
VVGVVWVHRVRLGDPDSVVVCPVANENSVDLRLVKGDLAKYHVVARCSRIGCIMNPTNDRLTLDRHVCADRYGGLGCGQLDGGELFPVSLRGLATVSRRTGDASGAQAASPQVFQFIVGGRVDLDVAVVERSFCSVEFLGRKMRGQFPVGTLGVLDSVHIFIPAYDLDLYCAVRDCDC